MKFLKLKKAAMFGLDNQKKENCHPELGSGSHEVNAKHAAMFGLDARIALAIFGALSVISGAALYSAIQSATVVKWQVYFNELTKATEAYYLDNGKKLPQNTSVGLHTRDLFTNRENLKNWSGPYLQSSHNGTFITDSMLMDVNAPIIHAIYSSNAETCQINNADCYIWINLATDSSVFYNGEIDFGYNLLKLCKLLDEKIDNGDGYLNGRIRCVDYEDGVIHLNYNTKQQYTRYL